jgi:hypothetical protein
VLHGLTLLLVLSASPEMRREESVDFKADEVFQQQGGVQYFYELAEPTPAPAEGSTLARFRTLDPLSTPDDPWFVVMSRIVYTVDRDVSFFTEKRARDVSYLQKVAPEMGVKLERDGVFLVTRTPSNRFTLLWLDSPKPTDAGLKRFFEFLPSAPASVVIQKNSNFSRVMGWRTAERSVTWTAHLPLGEGKTRISVCTMSLLHHLPPFFLGGKDRIFRESVEGAGTLIKQLRDYAGP